MIYIGCTKQQKTDFGVKPELRLKWSATEKLSDRFALHWKVCTPTEATAGKPDSQRGTVHANTAISAPLNILCSQVDDCAADWCSLTMMSVTQQFLCGCINNGTWGGVKKSAQFRGVLQGSPVNLPHSVPWERKEPRTALNQIPWIDGIMVVIKWTMSQTHANTLQGDLHC